MVHSPLSSRMFRTTAAQDRSHIPLFARGFAGYYGVTATSAMPKESWIIAGVLTAALLLGLLGYSSWDKKTRLDQAQAEMVKAQAAASKSKAELDDLKDQISQAQTQMEALRKERDAVVQTHRSLEDEMRAALESRDVTISQLQGKLTVNILDRVLFDSGEADLKPDGAAVLQKVATILQQHPNLKIHVIGHTDN